MKQLVFDKRVRPVLWGFTDASFAEDHTNKSHGGCALYLGTNLVQYYSRTQRWVSTSTGMSEMNEIHRTTQEVVVLKGMMADVGIMTKDCTATVFSDSATALTSIKGDTIKKRSKHLATKITYCRERSEDHDFLSRPVREIEPVYIPKTWNMSVWDIILEQEGNRKVKR